MSSVDCLFEARNILGECPIWNGADRTLYWIDSRGPTLFAHRAGAKTYETAQLPSAVGSIALRRSGGLLAALQTGIYAVDRLGASPTVLAQPETHLPDNRLNDGRCDRQGRFWVGSMNDKQRVPTGALYRMDVDRHCHHMRNDVIVPNSIAWSPDDRVMYFADTYRGRIWSYDFDAASGAISNQKVFVDTSSHPGRPDGSAVDADGCLWNAEYAGSRVVRYTPAGKIDRVIEMPVSAPSCCCFGGPQLDILFITTARQRLTPEQLEREPLAGGLFATHVGVNGLPEASYAG